MSNREPRTRHVAVGVEAMCVYVCMYILYGTTSSVQGAAGCEVRSVRHGGAPSRCGDALSAGLHYLLIEGRPNI
jgi:hypothetical protein